jgi:MerR family transcriptional regulator, copper efflux regulator
MLISELARETGLSTDTIRFYEKEGLLDSEHITRRSNSYRDYTPAAVERLLLIKRGQMIGFTLSEMRSFIRDWETNRFSDPEKEAMFLQKIAQIDAQIAELETMKTYLRKKLEKLTLCNPDSTLEALEAVAG